MATGIQAREDFDLRQKLHFLKRLRNTRIANKIGRSPEFKDYNNFSLAMCFGRALEMEGEFQVGGEMYRHRGTGDDGYRNG